MPPFLLPARERRRVRRPRAGALTRLTRITK
jgi:hypothetical protein